MFRSVMVNLFKQLFSRHPGSKENQPTVYHWPGVSGKTYEFQVHSLDASFRPLPGVYIYARHLPDGDWDPVYIAQTRDLHQRLEGHVSRADAISKGATHLHAHYCSAGPAARCGEEHDLVSRWQPVCNEQLET